MYIPKPFHQRDLESLLNVMKDNPFATLITNADGIPYPNHLPLLIEQQDLGRVKLLGHMARANPQWKHFETGQSVVVVFHGPHTYITPNWYRNPNNEVPTWNYSVVHIVGSIKLVDTFEGIHNILARSVQEFEKFESNPWSFPLSEQLERNLVNGIIGFEIEVTQIEGKFKLSQNRKPEDQKGVLQGLASRTDEMSKKIREMMLRNEKTIN